MVLKYRNVNVVHGMVLPAETSESESESVTTYEEQQQQQQQPHSTSQQQQLAQDRRSPRKQRDAPPLVGRDLSAVRKKAERRGAGVRRRRRYESHRELKQTLETLLEDAEPVAHEPIVAQSAGAFDKLFADAQNMKVWQEFATMSPAKQEKTVADLKKQRETKEIEVCMMTPLERYSCIDRSIRIVLRKNNLPEDTLKNLETDLLNFFDTDFDNVYVCKFGSFQRLLLHGLCQYLGFQSSSENVDGVRLTTVRCVSPFIRPTVLLSTLVESARVELPSKPLSETASE